MISMRTRAVHLDTQIHGFLGSASVTVKVIHTELASMVLDEGK